ncbi:MAG: hypothetical protein KH269_12875 [Faecalibacterium prausnitzii]|nr:hypothetical protein [Faecalibacterium prausnitzii]
MQHGAGGRGQDAQSPQKDEGRVEAESPDKIIAALRGRYFSFLGTILENFLSIRDFTSQTLASFPSDLVGACLPQTLPSNNKVHNCSMD